MTGDTLRAKERQKPPFRSVAFRPLPDRISFADNTFIDAVFSGGYYIVLSNDEIMPIDILSKTQTQTKRNRRNEEILKLCNRLHDINEQARIDTKISYRHEAASPENDHPLSHPALRDRLLTDLQALINKSNYNNTDFDNHLAHELDIARTHVLRGGAMDDFALMQTLQEIASIQGLSVAGTSMRGRFASDIMNEPEPENPLAAPAQSLTDTTNAIGATALDDGTEEFYLREYDQFCAYSVREIGGFKHKPSFFFAKKIMTSLLNAPMHEQAQDSAEIVP